jgi:hypothetical protein
MFFKIKKLIKTHFAKSSSNKTVSITIIEKDSISDCADQETKKPDY